MILNASCNRIKFNEMTVAEAQIAKVCETIGGLPFLVTMDRGYPSMPAFLRMIDNGTYFVARLKSLDFKTEQQALSRMTRTWISKWPKAGYIQHHLCK